MKGGLESVLFDHFQGQKQSKAQAFIAQQPTISKVFESKMAREESIELSEYFDEQQECISLSSDDTSQSGRTIADASAPVTCKDDALRKKIIPDEDKVVNRARCIVGTATLILAIAVSASVYRFTRQGDSRTFEIEYDLYASDIVNLVQWEAQYNFALMQQLSAAVTSTAILTGASFPNLTQPHFEITGGYVDGLGGIMAAAYAPLITSTDRAKWEEYSVANAQGWLKESNKLKRIHPGHLDPMHGTKQDHEHDRLLQSESFSKISEEIYRWEDGVKVAETTEDGQVFAPLWQVSPADSSAVNMNLFADKKIYDLYQGMIQTNHSVISGATEIGDDFDFLFDDHEKDRKKNPHAFLLEPVYSAFEENPHMVGILIAVTSFENLFDRILPTKVKGVEVVVSDSCGNDITYELNAIDEYRSKFLGPGDLHDSTFDEFRRSTPLELYESDGEALCIHDIHIYPSAKLRESYDTVKPAVYTSVIALAFVLTTLLLIAYDWAVTKRQNKTLRSALRSGALVESLFPENVRDRLLEDSSDQEPKSKKKSARARVAGPPIKLRPIADFFPEITLMFADISGFTAWSSTREPHKVFELLETIYCAFDEIAKKRGIFKIETVGDCYVAASGIPHARPDHAVSMARFCKDCMYRMNSLVKELEKQLGPGTGALSFRIGIHSGAVTGGVLRGDNARFQLFGDTVNTCARMESTGKPHHVQMSSTTAQLLIEAGKANWLTPREDAVEAKGKGKMKTYWLNLTGNESEGGSMSASERLNVDIESRSMELEDGSHNLNSTTMRLVDWNVDVLLRFLKQVNAVRQPNSNLISADKPGKDSRHGCPLEEVCEIIRLPNPTFALKEGRESSDFVLRHEVQGELYEFVTQVAQLYRNNPFHNFEHASHVTMSVVKLMSRIVAPSSPTTENLNKSYGITSDPLTQFACVFSALIHDIDHTGLPNSQLIKEASRFPIVAKYKGKSVAEQNSVDMAWDLLMRPEFDNFRSSLCATDSEMKRFRSLVVNSVLATDIMDKQLKILRNERWQRAFTTSLVEESPSDTINRKATIVIEHLIQASDVSHTMQHWHIYIKWNERLFAEMYLAYLLGHADKDPSENWYYGELGFFDNYVIPLAKKLSECGVFGVSSDEYLTYATKNREEYCLRGQGILAEMVEKYTVLAKDGRFVEQYQHNASAVPRRRSQVVSGVLPPKEDASEAWI